MTGRVATARCWSRAVALVCVAAVGGAPIGCARVGFGPEPVGQILPRIPRDAARFEIDRVNDSTVAFRVYEARWIRAGHRAYVVDPAQRDALVARLTVLRGGSTMATALITSQAARVTTEHVVLVVRPRTPWWRTRAFWYGLAAGGAIGVGAVTVVR